MVGGYSRVMTTAAKVPYYFQGVLPLAQRPVSEAVRYHSITRNSITRSVGSTCYRDGRVYRSRIGADLGHQARVI